MGLGNLGTAVTAGVTGRNVAQSSAAAIANNMANVDTEGYSRKELRYKTQVLGGIGSGVTATDLVRHTDMFKVEQIRVMTSELSKLETLASYYKDLNQQLGQPGENNSLCASLNDLKKNIEQLVGRPEIMSARSAMLQSAQNLAQDLQRLTTLVQNARIMADKQINSSVQDINNLLVSIENCNKEIRYASSQGQQKTELLDMRDKNIKQLAELMDFRVQYSSDDTVSLFANGGQTILQSKLHQLTFNMTSGINAGASHAGGTVNGVLLDNDPAMDITTSIGGGKLGGLIASRDVELPAFQAALDQLTGVLRDQVNAIHNRGTAANVPQSLNGNRSGQTVADNIVGAGSVAIAVIDRTTGQLVENTIVDLGAIGTLGALINQINGTAQATANLDPSGALHIQATNPAYGISIGSTSVIEANIGGLGFSHYFGLNDFFVTPSTLTGVAPGVASELAVRQAIVDDISLMANTALDTNGVVGDQVITVGGNSTLMEMAQMFSKKATFAAAGKIPGLDTSLSEYASMIIYYTSGEGRQLGQAYENQSATYDLSLASLEAIRGVNIQEEVMKLMQWQRQLRVCTQVILTAEEMMDELMRVKR